MSAPTRRLQGAKQALIQMNFPTAMVYCHGLLSSGNTLDLEQLWVFLELIDAPLFTRVFQNDSLRDSFLLDLARPPLSRARLLVIGRALETGCVSFQELLWDYWVRKNHFTDDEFFSPLSDNDIEYFAKYVLELRLDMVESVLDSCTSITTQHLSRCDGWQEFLIRAVQENAARWAIFLP